MNRRDVIKKLGLLTGLGFLAGNVAAKTAVSTRAEHLALKTDLIHCSFDEQERMIMLGHELETLFRHFLDTCERDQKPLKLVRVRWCQPPPSKVEDPLGELGYFRLEARRGEDSLE